MAFGLPLANFVSNTGSWFCQRSRISNQVAAGRQDIQATRAEVHLTNRQHKKLTSSTTHHTCSHSASDVFVALNAHSGAEVGRTSSAATDLIPPVFPSSSFSFQSVHPASSSTWDYGPTVFQHRAVLLSRNLFIHGTVLVWAAFSLALNVVTKHDEHWVFGDLEFVCRGMGYVS